MGFAIMIALIVRLIFYSIGMEYWHKLIDIYDRDETSEYFTDWFSLREEHSKVVDIFITIEDIA